MVVLGVVRFLERYGGFGRGFGVPVDDGVVVVVVVGDDDDGGVVVVVVGQFEEAPMYRFADRKTGGNLVQDYQDPWLRDKH